MTGSRDVLDKLLLLLVNHGDRPRHILSVIAFKEVLRSVSVDCI